MIRINLLKEVGKKKRTPVLNSKKIVVAAMAAGICIVVVGGIFFVQNLKKTPIKPKAPVAAVQTPEKVVDDYKPSVPLKPGMIEDIVHEISDSRTKALKEGVLNISYSEMSFVEKINYEVAYGKNVFTTLSRAVPSGIGLNSLEITNFQTVYAHGAGKTRELIASTFNELKKDKITLLQQPYSYITSDPQIGGYKFVVTCKPDYGLNLSDPFQAVDYLSSRESLDSILKKIVKIATQKGLKISSPKQLSAERVGEYRRFIYQIDGSGSYKDFVGLVFDLYNEQVVCAFKKVNIKAKTDPSVKISAELLITVKD